MRISLTGTLLGTAAAVAIAIKFTNDCVVGMRTGEAWCYAHFKSQPDELRYCLVQNQQGPAWAIGFGVQYAAVAFTICYLLGRAFDRWRAKRRA